MGNVLTHRTIVVKREPVPESKTKRATTAPKVLIVQYEDRPIERYTLQALLKQNELYCARHGYSYRLYPKTIEQTKPVPQKKETTQWLKVFLLERHLNDYDYIVWIDSDAVIYGMERSVPSFFVFPHVVFIGCASPPLRPSLFMTGVFMLRGKNEHSQKLMKDWVRGHSRSRSDGERKYFIDHVFPRHQAHILILPYHVFHEVNPCRHNARGFAYHLSGRQYQPHWQVFRPQLPTVAE